jgi:hypothetical protein
VDEIFRRIAVACENVTPVILQDTLRELGYVLDIFRATKGGHVEVY